jgi:hypothetical protein
MTHRSRISSILFVLVFVIASPTPGLAAGVSSWLCGVTGWFFCGLEWAGLVREPPVTGEKLSLERFDLQPSKETVLISDCSDCHSFATLIDGDILILRSSGLERWNHRSGGIDQVAQRGNLVELLGRYPTDPNGLLVTGTPTRDGLCPPIFRFDIRSRNLQRLSDPATNKSADMCPWLLSGPRSDQFDEHSGRLVVARGGGTPSTPSVILVEDLKAGTTRRLAEDPASPVNDGRSRYHPIWTNDGKSVIYLVAR